MDSLKKRYFTYHLGTSVIIIAVICLTCQFFWFPKPFLMLDGTWLALLILAVTDIIIGPLLTLLLVNGRKSKRERLIDFSVIIFIQISALSYGLIQIENERVAVLVHYEDVFHIVPKKELRNSDNNTEMITAPAVQQYKGIPLVMILEQDAIKFTQKKQNSKTPFLYAIENFKVLERKELEISRFEYKNLPNSIAMQYDQHYIFKTLVGKQRSAVVVFKPNMDIVDIHLLSKTP